MYNNSIDNNKIYIEEKLFSSQLKKYIILSIIYLTLSFVLVYNFLYMFYALEDFSIFLFLIILVLFGLFIFYIMKAFEEYLNNKRILKEDLEKINEKMKETPENEVEKNTKKENKNTPQKNIRKKSFMNSFLSILENFPYENRFSGSRRIIIKYLGWFVLIYFFIVSVIIRIHIEFLSSSVALIFIIHDLCYYGFAFAGGTLIMHYFSDAKLSKVIKAGLMGFAIIIQVPTAVDYSIYGTSESMRVAHYGFVEWSDFLKAFNSFLLDPKIQSYACLLGHPVMFLFLIILVGLYVFTNNYTPEGKESTGISISLIKTFLSVISLYIFLQLSGVIEPMIKKIFTQIYTFLYLFNIYTSMPHPNYILISVYFFVFVVYFLIWVKIHKEEMEKNKLRKNVKKKSISEFEYLDEYLSWIEETEKKYKSKYALKLNILIVSYLILSIIFLIIIPP